MLTLLPGDSVREVSGPLPQLRQLSDALTARDGVWAVITAPASNRQGHTLTTNASARTVTLLAESFGLLTS